MTRTASGARSRERRFGGSAVPVALALALALLAPEAAGACAVCYGAADSPLTTGMNNGILVLLGVVAVVQLGFVALFVGIWRRTRRLDRQRSRLHLIQGGVR